MSLISKIIKTKILAGLVSTALYAVPHAPAHAGVDLAQYGLKLVEPTAVCVSQRMSSAASNDVAHLYWTPVTQLNGRCSSTAKLLNALDISNARSSFLSALSSCVGYQVTSDTDIGVRMVADAVSVIAADGVRDSLTGQSLLEKFNIGANTCNPPAERTKTAGKGDLHYN